MSSPDDVAERHAKRTQQLTIRLLDPEYILVEGSRAALLFASELIAAVAEADDCGFQIGPAGAGSALFSSDSTQGLYIHRIPCDHIETAKKDGE